MKLLITSSYCKSKNRENWVQRLYQVCRLAHAVTAQRGWLPVGRVMSKRHEIRFFFKSDMLRLYSHVQRS